MGMNRKWDGVLTGNRTTPPAQGIEKEEIDGYRVVKKPIQMEAQLLTHVKASTKTIPFSTIRVTDRYCSWSHRPGYD